MRSDAKWPFTGDVNIKKAFPILYFSATDAPTANQKIFRLTNYQGDMYIQPCDDAGNFQQEAFKITRQGDVVVAAGIFEKQRTAKLGYTQQWNFSSGDFWGSGGMTFTPDIAGSNYSYWSIGNRVYLSFFLSGTVGGTPDTYILFYTPNHWSSINAKFDFVASTLFVPNVGYEIGRTYVQGGTNYLITHRLSNASFPLGTVSIAGEVSFPVN
jgi:hypothetical protein